MKQMSLPTIKTHKTHGGELSIGKRKVTRPFTRKKAVHVTFRSTRAKGKYSLYYHRKWIDRKARDLAKRHGVKIYELGIGGKHLHSVLSAKTRGGFQDFLRVFAGLVARKVTGARKAKPFGKFWDLLAWSRILEWGRDFRNAVAYVLQNEKEGLGLVPYRARKREGPPK